MSELLHPQIEFDTDDEQTSEISLVSDLIAILRLQARPKTYFVGDMEVETAETQNVEVFSKDSDKGVAMRVRRVPVMATADLQAGEMYPSSDYLVFTVEFSEFDPLDEIEDEEGTQLDWQPYITAIVDREDSENPEIVETSNGRKLDELGLMRAGSIIDIMKKEAVAMVLGDELFLGLAEPNYKQPGVLNSASTNSVELTARAYGSPRCRYCTQHELECSHPQAN